MGARVYARPVAVPVTDRDRTPERTRRGRFVRYAAGSAGAVLVSALAFAIAYRLLGLGPQLASGAAFLAGALVNFSASRFWAWQRRQRSGLGRDVVAYVLLALGMAVVALGVTSLTDAELAGADPTRRAILVEVSYFATYAALFLVRFLVLDRVVFRSRHQVPKSASPVSNGSSSSGSSATSSWPSASVVTRYRAPRAAARWYPRRSAAPWPRFTGTSTVTAPCARATAAVSSVAPSTTTRLATRYPRQVPGTASSTAPSAGASLYAPISTTTGGKPRSRSSGASAARSAGVRKPGRGPRGTARTPPTRSSANAGNR